MTRGQSQPTICHDENGRQHLYTLHMQGSFVPTVFYEENWREQLAHGLFVERKRTRNNEVLCFFCVCGKKRQVNVIEMRARRSACDFQDRVK